MTIYVGYTVVQPNKDASVYTKFQIHCTPFLDSVSTFYSNILTLDWFNFAENSQVSAAEINSYGEKIHVIFAEKTLKRECVSLKTNGYFFMMPR